MSTFNLIERQDYSVVGIKENGEVILISSNERDNLAKVNQSKLGKDYEYLNEIFGMSEDRKPGVYTTQLGDAVSKIWLRDSEGNYFELDSDGNSSEVIAS